MPNENELTVTHYGEHLVKTSDKQSGKLRNFFGRILKEATKIISYVPGVKFITSKLQKDDDIVIQKGPDLTNGDSDILPAIVEPINQTETPEIEKPVETKPEEAKEEEKQDQIPADEPSFTSSIFDFPVSNVKTSENVEIPKPEIEENKIEENKVEKEASNKTILGRKIFAKPKEMPEESAELPKENSVIKPVDIDIDIPDIPATNKEDSKPKKSDTELLEDSRTKYGNLIKFNTWKDYYHSFSDEEREKKIELGEMLDAKDFGEIRLDQAKTIKRITQTEEDLRQEKITQLNKDIENRKNNIKTNKGEINRHNQEINRLRNENKQLNESNKNDTNTVDVLEKESERANDKIEEMNAIIQPSKKENKTPIEKPEKKQKIKPKKQSKTNAAKKRVEEILKEEEARLERQKKVAEPKENSPVTEKKETPKEVAPQTYNHSLADELADFDNEKQEEKSPVINWKNNYINNSTDNFAQAEKEINNSDMSDEEKLQERQALYNQFDNFVEANYPTETKHRHR